ncbi:DUF3822 family protein [Dokdonia sinensis]|uniref:DUF3822 family protein n=1 Tax=Dokdonia sinensis TaxID=2479847 RepID=A0A3M0GTG1_9FLAO|nr:DUF3822 family protein [Dokdonia sinensis]RMB60616.1 DUF3822 family protein [Dokdonia sinensis]
MTNKQEQTTYNRSLSIQVRLDGLSFFTQNLDSNEILAAETMPFTHKVDAAGLLPKIQSIFEKHKALQHSFKEVNVIYVNALFTLVPRALFKESALTDYLKFNTKILKTDFVTYDEIANQELMNVYIPYANVNNFFFEKFGSFRFYHAISKLIEKIGNQGAINPEGCLHINIHSTSFELVIIQNKKLKLANVFNYITKEDFIYYILFTIEQLELDPEKLEVKISGAIDKNDKRYTFLYKYIRNISISTPEHKKLGPEGLLLSTLL